MSDVNSHREKVSFSSSDGGKLVSMSSPPPPPPPAAPEDMEAVRSLLDDAIELTPSQEKESYLQAVLQCPELVQEESDPFVFLQYEDYDIFRAAKRLLKYWEWRVEIYQERAFLKVNDLTGFGALDELTIRVVGSRATLFLPGRDHQGTITAFYDRSQLGKEFYDLDPRTFLKAAFFGYQNVIDKHRSEGCPGKAGYGLLNLLSSSLPAFLGTNKCWANLIKEAMPFELRWVRLLILPSENKEGKTLWFKAIVPSLQLMLLKRLPFTNMEIISCETRLAMKNKLVKLGLKEENLPECIGGTLKIDDYWGRDDDFRMIERTVYHTRGYFLGSKNPDLEWEPSFADSADPEKSRESCCHLYPLENVIDDAVPFGDKVAVLKAKQYAMETYRKESYQPLFLAFHQHNSLNAAFHLCKHWQLRNQLFSDKAFVVMNQLGNGALSKVDIEVLRSGIIQVLPNDNSGNVVLLYDHSKTSKHPFPSIRRCFFYVLHRIIENSFENGNDETPVRSRLIFRANDCQGTNKKKHRGKKHFTDILEVFPFRFAGYHVIPNVKDSSLDTNSNPCEEAALQLLVLFDPPQENVVIYDEKSSGISLFNLLQDHGFSPRNIPHYIIGGQWTDEAFFLWQDGIIQDEIRKKNNTTSTTTQKTMDVCFHFCKNDLEWKQSSKKVGDGVVVERRRKNPPKDGQQEVVEKQFAIASSLVSPSNQPKVIRRQVRDSSNRSSSNSQQFQQVVVENTPTFPIPHPNNSVYLTNAANMSFPYSFRRGVVDFWRTKMLDTSTIREDKIKDEMDGNDLN